MAIKKIVRKFLILSVLIFAGIFLLNYFLANRLEKYLRKEITERVSDATDHFYNLTFSSLSINLLNGELSIRDIELKPDSSILRQWEMRDSLPDVYVNANIDAIDFKGVNLIWKWNVGKLHFHAFNIQSPVIKVTNAYYSSQSESGTRKNTGNQTLYEFIEPYINELTVRHINLENVGISYHVEHPLSPIIYKLNDVNFHAYEFRLDSLSSRSGKLLYADNFEFTTNRQQTILENSDFSLMAGDIRLSTRDSIIHIAHIHFIPQADLWSKTKKKPSNFLDGTVTEVHVDGIFFERENALNYLKANSFLIDSTDLKIYNLASGSTEKAGPSTADADSFRQSLTPYQLISPILHSVAIDQIQLRNTKVNYLYTYNDSIENLNIDSLNFYAYDFLIDSVSEKDPNFWYCRAFNFDATGLEGVLKGRNHIAAIKYVKLDTEKGIFDIGNIRLSPLSTRTKNDYVEGEIASVNLNDLVYDKGISAGLFKIDSPRIRYVKNASSKKENGERPGNVNKPDAGGILNPLLSYLSIREIQINNADFRQSERNDKVGEVFSLHNFNFSATDFVLNEITLRKRNELFFDYRDFRFDFTELSSLLSDKKYRLSLHNADFSTRNGKLSFRDVALLSQEKSDAFIQMNAPLLEITKPNLIVDTNHSPVGIASVSVDNLNLDNAEIAFNHNGVSLKQSVSAGLQGFNYDNKNGVLNVEDVNFQTENLNIVLDNGFYNLFADQLSVSNSTFEVHNIRLKSPYSKHDFAYKHPNHSDWFDVSAKSFSVLDIDIPLLFRDNRLSAKKGVVDHAVIENYKNRQIKVPERLVPMIYENIQKAPLRFHIDNLMVQDMDVIYEELAPNGITPGKIYFTEMNGNFQDFTNIVNSHKQYIRLETNGKFMDHKHFTGIWMLPVDSLNDHFCLFAHLPEFDLKVLNEIITPLAPVAIDTGRVENLAFTINGNSQSADIYMWFLYNDLIVNYLKGHPGEDASKHRLYSALINLVVRNNNPRREHGNPHIVDITVDRDPYHSTFNYIWQILRPSLGDAVGISQTVQNILTGTANFFNEIKSIFTNDDTE